MRKLSLVVFISLSLGLFVGWKLTSNYFEKEINVMILEIKEQNEKNHNKSIEKQVKDTEQLVVTLGELNNETQQINNQFYSLSQLNIERLQSDNSSGNKLLPADTTTTERTTAKKKSQCVENNKRKLRELYEQQLTIARDCDITATYYNKLLELYNNVR